MCVVAHSARASQVVDLMPSCLLLNGMLSATEYQLATWLTAEKAALGSEVTAI